MKVKELIIVLQKYNSDANVQVTTEGVLCDIISVEEYYNKTLVVIEG